MPRDFYTVVELLTQLQKLFVVLCISTRFDGMTFYAGYKGNYCDTLLQRLSATNRLCMMSNSSCSWSKWLMLKIQLSSENFIFFRETSTFSALYLCLYIVSQTSLLMDANDISSPSRCEHTTKNRHADLLIDLAYRNPKNCHIFVHDLYRMSYVHFRLF